MGVDRATATSEDCSSNSPHVFFYFPSIRTATFNHQVLEMCEGAKSY